MAKVDRNLMEGTFVFGYHRVVSALHADPFDRALEVSTKRFEEQIDLLAQHYTIVDLETLSSRIVDRRPTARMASITFDDGYADNYECAAPILSRKGIPATVFLATNFVEEGRPF